jgi:hypothetical protein
MTNKPDDFNISVPWNDLIMLEARIRYAKRHLCEAVMFAHGDIVHHIDQAYIDLVRATEAILQLIKGDQNTEIVAPS